MRLAADVVLSRAERLWVEIAGGRHRWRDRRNLHPLSGRTSPDHLRKSGISDAVWPLIQEALDRGVPPQDLAAAVESAAAEGGEQLAMHLRRLAPQMLRDHRALKRGMQRRMRAIWGSAFDAFYEVYVCVEELGSDLQQLHVANDDPLVAALLGLHARGCLVLAEVHSLMTQGFPLGAWARTRSLHETAVIATVLGENGREAASENLGERFLLHAVVDEARDLEIAVGCGLEVDDDELASVREQRDAVVARYGREFAKDYGWARPLFPSLTPKSRITFARLEDLANSGLQRLDYRLGGHHVHSSAWTVALNEVPRGTTVYRLTGPTNIGFGDPAAVAFAATLASTSAIVHGVAPLPEPMYLAGLHALHTLSVRAMELFAKAQMLVDLREERSQSRGRPWIP